MSKKLKKYDALNDYKPYELPKSSAFEITDNEGNIVGYKDENGEITTFVDGEKFIREVIMKVMLPAPSGTLKFYEKYGSEKYILAMSVDGGEYIAPTSEVYFSTGGSHTVKFLCGDNSRNSAPLFVAQTIQELIVNTEEVKGLEFYEIGSYSSMKLSGSVKKWTHITSKECERIARIDLPNLEEVETFLVQNANYLTEVNLPKLKSIPETASFANCSALRYIDFPNVTFVSSGAFSGCTSVTYVNLPKAVVYNSGNIFYNASNLEEIHLESVEKLDGGSISFNSVKRIYLNNIKRLMSGSFNNLEQIESICYGKTIAEFESIQKDELWIADSNPNCIVRCVDGDLSIPKAYYASYYSGKKFLLNGLTELSNSTITNKNQQLFEGKYVSSLDIPSSVTYINTLIRDTQYITSVHIPSNVKRITMSFANCTNLSNVEIEEGVTYIDGFSQCPFSSIQLPNSLNEIGNATFQACNNLSSLIIPESVTSVGTAILGCTSLTSITISSNITSWGSTALGGCSNLKEIRVFSQNEPFAVGEVVFGSVAQGGVLHVKRGGSVETFQTWMAEGNRLASKGWTLVDDL